MTQEPGLGEITSNRQEMFMLSRHRRMEKLCRKGRYFAKKQGFFSPRFVPRKVEGVKVPFGTSYSFVPQSNKRSTNGITEGEYDVTVAEPARNSM